MCVSSDYSSSYATLRSCVSWDCRIFQRPIDLQVPIASQHWCFFNSASCGVEWLIPNLRYYWDLNIVDHLWYVELWIISVVSRQDWSIIGIWILALFCLVMPLFTNHHDSVITSDWPPKGTWMQRTSSSACHDRFCGWPNFGSSVCFAWKTYKELTASIWRCTYKSRSIRTPFCWPVPK